MFKQLSTKIFLTALSVIFAALAGSQKTVAASVKFTAEVPNGMTQFQDLVQFSVANHDNDFTSDQLEIGAGATGSGIASAMGTELTNFSSFNGTVSGNMLAVQNASTGAYMANAEIGMSMEVSPMGDGCVGCHLPDLPYVGHLPGHEVPSLIVFLGGSDGQPAPVHTDGVVILSMSLPGIVAGTFAFSASFAPGMTTTDIIGQLDVALRNTAWPTGVEYFGLENGFPTLELGGDADLRVRVGAAPTISNTDPGFLVGAAAIGAVPEPDSLALFSTSAALLVCSVRRRAFLPGSLSLFARRVKSNRPQS